MQREEVYLELSSECNMIHMNNEKEREFFDFSRLPWMVFLSILKFLKISELCQLCLVNKLWHEACRDPSLWRHLDLMGYSSISNEDLNRLTSFSNNVVRLRISQCEKLTDLGVMQALKQCSSLVEFCITNCRKLSDDVLITLGEKCPHLRKLDITLSLGFSNSGLNKVCEGCPELEEIIIDQCTKFTNDALVCLGLHSSKLRCISALNIANITDEGIIPLLQGCSQLLTLQFPFCGLTSLGISHIAEYGKNIVYLDVRGVKLEDNDVHNMVSLLYKLETLNLGLCHNLTNKSAIEIGRNCKQLKNLFLVNSKITDEGLIHLSEHCKSLLHLDVSWSQAVTELGTRYILNSCQKLKHLGLFRCDKVSESAVENLILEFPDVFISTLTTEMKKSSAKKEDAIT